jgi:hypothetical protein
MVRTKVKELLESLLSKPDGYRFNEDTDRTGTCGLIVSSGVDDPYRNAYQWCEVHAKNWLRSTDSPWSAYVDHPVNTLTPKRRQFIEYLLTQLHDLPEGGRND